MRWTEDEYAGFLAAQQRPGTAQPVEEPEARFQARILRLARQHGWLCYHTRDSRGSAEGFPDLVMVRESIIFAELKTRTGKLTAEQERWLTMLSTTQSRVEVYCWRPAQWAVIEHRLTEPWREDA
jgi:hypothetical protein